MNWIPLPVFPEGSLASSIVTTVWVGVLVFSFMNLRFGWVFSGLVVPGYLVPLLIVKPWAAGVIVAESVITLWTVQGLSRLLAKSGVACEFFGRDRFLALLMVSTFYRVVADVWLLPRIGEWVTGQLGIAFDYRNNLQSFGLIVICLAANQLWKTGVRKGAFPFVFNIAVTYLIVRYGLMELTNFNITNLSYLYEDIATSVFASPKAYIILLTTAILASRMNLLYGWDFNGILIPALIALQWYEPLKVVTSFVEAVFILFIVVQLLKFPAFRSVTMEGSRKFLLFFTVSFAYKMAVGWALFYLKPEVRVSDYYGFGYLLPTLMAIKMHQHERVWHQMRITAQVSLVSVFVANVIGFSLTFVSLGSNVLAGEPPGGRISETRHYEIANLREEAYRSYIDLHQSILKPGSHHTPFPGELILFEKGLADLLESGDFDSSVHNNLAKCGYRIDSFGDRYYRVSPVSPATNRPLVFVNRKAEAPLTISCLDALEENQLFEVSLSLFEDQAAQILVIGGDCRDAGGSWNASVHYAAGHKGTVEVCSSGVPGVNRLHVKRSLPQSFELKRLEPRFGNLESCWADSDRENLIRDISNGNYCELHVGRFADSLPAQIIETEAPIEAVIRAACYEFAPRASGLYVAPSEEELLHMDRHILEPLFRLDEDTFRSGLSAIKSAARYYGYDVAGYQSPSGFYVVLWEPRQKKNWGSVIVRLSKSDHLCFEVPSRVRDRSLLTFASTQFRRFRARALIVAGSNTLTNPDATSKLTVASNRSNLFNLAHQVFCRSDLIAPTVIQCRAYLPPVGELYPEGDIIEAPYFGNFPAESIHESLAPIRQRMAGEGLKITSLAYDDTTSRYAPGFNVQARYMDFTNQGTFALFWLSPFLRENYELQSENQPLHKMLQAVGVPIVEDSLTKWIGGRSFGLGDESHRIKQEIRAFRETHDIEVLESLVKEQSCVVVLDPASSQIFLVTLDRSGRITLIANLARNAPDRVVDPGTAFVESFIDSRAAWMEKTRTTTGK